MGSITSQLFSSVGVRAVRLFVLFVWGAQACLAVEALANAGHAGGLKGAGAVAAVEAAKESITNERNKVYPDRALAALC